MNTHTHTHGPTIIHRMSRNVRWLWDAPIAHEGGYLYFRLSVRVRHGSIFYYAKVRGKNARYWLDHLLHNTLADEVEHITREIA